MGLLIPALLDSLEDAGFAVGTSTPRTVGTGPTFVRVMRTGGGDDTEQLRDEPIVDFEIYGADYQTTDTVARKVREHVTGLRGKYLGNLLVRRSFCVSGPVPIPDNNPKITRLLLTFEMSVWHTSKRGKP